MGKTTTILIWIATVLLCGIYLFPLWEINLQAPQYPNGLGIRIWIDRITGRGPHDLQNINGLNHYIGMKPIEPDSIPELGFMKYVGGLLIGLAGATAFFRRRWLLVVFVTVAIVVAAAGLYDFWKWEYEYGHDLDPSAAIKVPGMSYQPPLFGTKQLLNFRTTAWPGIGGWCAILGVALGVVALGRELLGRRRRAEAGSVALVLAAVVFVPGCSTEPRAIRYGVDACELCRMTVTDSRYGSELVTDKGRVYTFDSVECLARATREGGTFDPTDLAGRYVTDFRRPGTLVDATGAGYLISEKLPSPMGMNLTAFRTPAEARAARARFGGEVLDWTGLREHFRADSARGVP